MYILLWHGRLIDSPVVTVYKTRKVHRIASYRIELVNGNQRLRITENQSQSGFDFVDGGPHAHDDSVHDE